METLAHLFDWLLTASARASLLSVVVIGLQVLLRHRVPARWRYALWLPVLLVLLTPAFPESQWSVGSIVRTAPAPLPVPVMVAQESALNVAPSAVGVAETPSPISWSQIMLPAWLLGAAGMIVICIGSSALTLWRIKHNRVPVNDALLHEIAALVQGIGLRRVPRVWMSPVVRSPAVTGLWRPVLLLPVQFDESLTAQEARLVLRHELTHLKRGDLPLNALLCLLLALHWFNPLLWLAFFKVRLDREAACDAQVLDREPQAERVAYGHTLLRVETAFSHHGLSLGFVGIFQRGRALRSRIQSIATPSNPHPLMKTTLSLGIALLTFLGITKAAPPDNNAPQVLIEAKFIEVGEEAKDLLAPFAATGKSPSVSVMLNDEQLSTLWKKIETTKGVDVLSMPRVTTRSGQEAKIEVGREFAYKDDSGKPATKQLGTVLTLLPKITGEHEIDLDVSPQIVELEGMVKLESGVERPVFKERKATASVAMMSGQTVALGLPSASTKQTTEDRSAGHVTSKTEDVIRHTVVFVTARLLDPASGKPVGAKPADEKTPLQAKLARIILPSVVFADATVSEAVEFLRRKSLDLDTTTTDPNQKGVNMIVKAGGNIAEARITLDLKNIPLDEALKYVAQLSNLRLVVERYAVTLISQADFEAQQNQAGSPVSGNQGMVITSDSLTHDKVSGVVTAVGDVKIETPQGSISAEKAAIKPNTRPKPAAGEIILPKVQFHEATLAEAVEFLRIKSRELDPEKKGLNILIKPGGDPMAKITMQLKDVPAYEALRYVAEISGCNLTVEGDVFVITPVRSERK
jgi:beta-lactamase regulating signal transducer with metallopeptidase domain